MSGGVLLPRKHPGRGLLPLPRRHLFGGPGTDCEFPVRGVHRWKLLPGGLYGPDAVFRGNVPDGHRSAGCQRVPEVRARMGVRFDGHVGDDHSVSLLAGDKPIKHPADSRKDKRFEERMWLHVVSGT